MERNMRWGEQNIYPAKRVFSHKSIVFPQETVRYPTKCVLSQKYCIPPKNKVSRERTQ